MITPPRRADGPLVLADIGGYTSFLRVVQVAHAEDAFADGNVPDAYGFVSSLLDGIVGELVPPFTLSKLEGDAVFAYAETDAALPRGDALLACIEACYAEFQRRLGQAHDIWTCRCDACMRINELDLKFILHAGPYVIQSIAGAAELVGPEVVMAHRLLKNDALAVLGSGAYALLTADAVQRFGVPTDAATPMPATYEHYEPIDTFLYRLPRA
ncbi:MAG TPA: DUF2652 domain-containing protein [Candidatus Limnocylindrales bacterium]|nr:DUF2652 domain-containing protein [Candidatus Limnocylindrales bacterium]